MANGQAARSNVEVMVGGLTKLSPKAAEQNRRALRRMRGARTVEHTLYREQPDGDGVDVEVVVEYRLQGAESDVGIMSGWVEVTGVYLGDAAGPELHWSPEDEIDFEQDVVPDLVEDSGEYDGPDTEEEARGER